MRYRIEAGLGLGGYGGPPAEIQQTDSPFPIIKDSPILPTPKEVMSLSQDRLRRSLDKEIDVPAPPPELFADWKKLEARGIKGFKAAYLPPVEMPIDSQLWGGIKPDNWLWKRTADGTFSPDTVTLKGGWYLYDGRTKPDYTQGTQSYEDDYMALFMDRLRRAKYIEDRFNNSRSRFGASAREIDDVILPVFSHHLGISGNLRNMRAIEFAALGLLAHPEWGQTSSWHIFADRTAPRIKEDQHIIGGGSQAGGLGYYYWNSVDMHDDDFAFSPVIEYSFKAS